VTLKLVLPASGENSMLLEELSSLTKTGLSLKLFSPGMLEHLHRIRRRSTLARVSKWV